MEKIITMKELSKSEMRKLNSKLYRFLFPKKHRQLVKKEMLYGTTGLSVQRALRHKWKYGMNQEN